MRAASPPTTSRRAWSMSCRAISRMPSRCARSPNPSISSGVYVLPAPITAILGFPSTAGDCNVCPVHSLGKFPDIFMAEIAGQPDAIRRAAAAAEEQAGRIVRLRQELGRRGRVVLTGMGSSYDACYPAATLLASAGVMATMVDAAELLHFRLDALDERTLLVCVSQSGESAETVRVAHGLRARARRPFLAAVTNGTENSLAGLADLALDTRGGEEHGPSTMTFAATLVVMAAVARGLAGLPPAAAGDAEAAAAAVERLTADPQRSAGALSAWLGDRPMLALLGRGESRAAAEMAALTLKEAARFPAESLQAAQ